MVLELINMQRIFFYTDVNQENGKSRITVNNFTLFLKFLTANQIIVNFCSPKDKLIFIANNEQGKLF